MAINFTCSHCQKPLRVKEELAGKKAKCPRCQKVVVIPDPTPAVPSVDVEMLAAAALTEQPPAPEAPAEPRFVDFTCSFCDEKVQVPAELAGKQAPCPSCRRIVKVPVLVKEGPKDWRKQENRLPAGARREDGPAPEGAWGTATTTHVSSEALVEADAIPVVKERLSLRQWVTRGLLATVGVAAVVGVVLAVMHSRREGLQTRAIKLAVELGGAEGASALPAVDGAELHRALGEFFLKQDQLDEAQRHLKQARALAMQLKGGPEHDALLIRIARTQTSLGGDVGAVTQKTRLSWNDTRDEIKKTLLPLRLADSRAQAIRELAGLLFEKNQGALASPLIFDMTQVPQERSELLAIVGLQMHARKNEDLAKTYAKRALTPYQTRPGAKPGDKTARPPAASSLIALLLALDMPDDAKTVALPPRPQDIVPTEVRVGYAAGLAWKDQWDAALALANDSAATTPQRLDALAAVAEVSSLKQGGQVSKAIEAATALMPEPAARLASPWALIRLVRAGIQEKLPAARMNPLVDGLTNVDLQRDIHAELFDAFQANDTSQEFAPGENEKSWGALWTEILARRLARQGKSADVMNQLESWQAGTRALGFAGVALGLQDGQ